MTPHGEYCNSFLLDKFLLFFRLLSFYGLKKRVFGLRRWKSAAVSDPERWHKRSTCEYVRSVRSLLPYGTRSSQERFHVQGKSAKRSDVEIALSAIPAIFFKEVSNRNADRRGRTGIPCYRVTRGCCVKSPQNEKNTAVCMYIDYFFFFFPSHSLSRGKWSEFWQSIIQVPVYDIVFCSFRQIFLQKRIYNIYVWRIIHYSLQAFMFFHRSKHKTKKS